jgi:hypothetical protein
MSQSGRLVEIAKGSFLGIQYAECGFGWLTA